MNANAHKPAIDESLLAGAPTHISPPLGLEDDERRLDEFVGSATHEGTTPTVLHVHMKCSFRPPLTVELFKGSILDPDGQWGHLWGVREVGTISWT